MRKREGFEIEELEKGTYWIRETTGLHMYLIIGKERAALFDTGIGLGNLPGVVASITDKPVLVCLTHYHHDHAGGAGNFSEVLISEEDAPYLHKGTDLLARKGFLDVLESVNVIESYDDKDLAPDRKVAIRTVKPGDVIDLGERNVLVCDMKGHTPGSVGYFDENTGTLFAGDGCNNSTFMFIKDSLDISVYKETLINLKNTLGERLKKMVICHDYTYVPIECIDNVIECCDLILSGKSEDDYFETPLEKGPETYARWAKKGGPNRVDGKFGNIVYDTRRIR